jgi:hypothetical protein
MDAMPLFGLQGQLLGVIRRPVWGADGITAYELETDWQCLMIDARRVAYDPERGCFHVAPG